MNVKPPPIIHGMLACAGEVEPITLAKSAVLNGDQFSYMNVIRDPTTRILKEEVIIAIKGECHFVHTLWPRFQFGFNMFHEITRPFNMTYKCYSVSMLPGNERQDVERGGKIIMPPSALDQLTRLSVVYPMIFKLTNKTSNRITHCGVLEFVADEGKIYLPHWMMSNLALEEETLVKIESVSLPVATFSRFQPLSEDFLDITNPKAVLENGLRNFACLTTSDVIAIQYNSKVYELCVLETKPGNAVTIIECDMNVEFAPPVGYKEEEYATRSGGASSASGAPDDDAALMPEPAGFVPFKGEGNRLDGKKRKPAQDAAAQHSQNRQAYVRGIPDYDYVIGTLRFIRNSRPASGRDEIAPAEQFEPFKGEGFTLRASKSNQSSS